MWYSPSRLMRRSSNDGVAGGTLRPALVTGWPRTADAQSDLSTRTLDALAEFAALPSIFERLHRPASEPRVRAWSELNDDAHADRRAPPGRDKGGRDQGKSNRGI